MSFELKRGAFELARLSVKAPPGNPEEAQARLDDLTKPPGSLGRLEELALTLAVHQDGAPVVDKVAVAVFAADHGISARGVSAYPREVTRQMVLNFLGGGAAVTVLARQAGADLWVADLGVLGGAFEDNPRLWQVKAGEGSQDFLQGPAMSKEQLAHCLDAGASLAQTLVAEGARVLVGGEMGIGNTTSASAICCLLGGMSPEEAAGRGTGLDEAGVARKVAVLKEAVEKHGHLTDPLEILQAVGGFEVAALVGFFVGGAAAGATVVVDGFITQAAALVAQDVSPKVKPWLVFSHQSAEKGAASLKEILRANPYLNFGMRLGEGTGGLLLVLMMKAAAAIYRDMATFSQAGVSGKDA